MTDNSKAIEAPEKIYVSKAGLMYSVILVDQETAVSNGLENYIEYTQTALQNAVVQNLTPTDDNGFPRQDVENGEAYAALQNGPEEVTVDEFLDDDARQLGYMRVDTLYLRRRFPHGFRIVDEVK